MKVFFIIVTLAIVGFAGFQWYLRNNTVTKSYSSSYDQLFAPLEEEK